MVYRIEVGLKNEPGLAKKCQELLGLPVAEAFALSVYSLDFPVSSDELKNLAENAFCDKIVEKAAFQKPWVSQNPFHFDLLIEKRFKPGVTDAVGKTAKQVASAVLQRALSDEENVYCATQYLFRTGTAGKGLTQQDGERIASQLLGNPLIEQFIILTKDQYKDGERVPATVPKVVEMHKPIVEEVALASYSDQQLQILNQYRQMGLNMNELKAIQKHFKDADFTKARIAAGLSEKITDAELEVFAQTWSEHCKHKEFAAQIEYKDAKAGGKTEIIDGLFGTYIAGATKQVSHRSPWLVSVFKDNAGVVRFNEDYYFSFKVETHNSPSALDPYGGALTGIVGNNRDVAGVGMGGSDLWFNQFYYCLGNPHYDGPLPPKTLHPRQIFEGVIAGVKDGGNKCGIPTLNGGLSFDPRFMAKPLVYCGTGGLMKATIAGKDSAEKRAVPGDLAVTVGGRIGKDGIHGATMSSDSRSETTPVTAVQIGDPIVQKVMLDFLAVCRDNGWIRGITDNGAGGLSSSFGEMARLSDGVRIDIGKAPLKYHGLQPWEILISEAQERMSVVILPAHIDAFLKLAKDRGVEADVLGEFTDSGFFEVHYNGKPIVYLDLEFLHKGVPKKKLQAEWRGPTQYPNKAIPVHSVADTTRIIASSLDACSKEWIFRQKDHNVKGGTLLPPIGGVKGQVNTPASLIKPVFLDSKEAVATSQGAYPQYSDFDTRQAALCAFNEAVGKLVALGAHLPDEETFWSACDNVCVPDSVYSERNPDGKYKLAQLVRLCQGMYDYAVALGIPFTSGKDSMKNDLTYEKAGKTHKISVPPTLLISLVTKINDYTQTKSIDFKADGDLIYVVGMTKNELGGSQYAEQLGINTGTVPSVNPAESKQLFNAIHTALPHSSSAYYVQKGGLALALGECALAGGLGAEVDLNGVPKESVVRSDLLMASESQNRFLITIRPENKAAFVTVLQRASLGQTFRIAYAHIGTVSNQKRLQYKTLEGKTESMSLQEFSDAYTAPLREDLPEVRT
ncbi:phosphoribosylformylglycinamidine synthase [Candidatus Micrarchaeota archaeon]|nr:phosphoribosylformylglycinamidine synthase [Candidatus Micrarchaeota archaeon]